MRFVSGILLHSTLGTVCPKLYSIIFDYVENAMLIGVPVSNKSEVLCFSKLCSSGDSCTCIPFVILSVLVLVASKEHNALLNKRIYTFKFFCLFFFYY